MAILVAIRTLLLNCQLIMYLVATQLSICLAACLAVSYFDIKYRRIPNKLILSLLIGGASSNAFLLGKAGVSTSLLGMLLAFGLMLLLHIFGALGAGDVKLFAALGAVLGVQLVLPTFVIVAATGGLLALGATLMTGTARVTGERVLLIFGGIISGTGVPRFPVPDDKRLTLPYGVAIAVGSLISLIWHAL